jgi:His/Glu/Gln/Arg/opine family amino acid ABC transporter permease subunit
MEYDWNFRFLSEYWPAIFHGLLLTVVLTICVIVLGSVLGVIWGVMLCSKQKLVRMPMQTLTDVIRGLPAIVLLMLTYYLIPYAIPGISIPPFAIAVLALATNLGAYMSDVLRGAIINVPVNFIDAGKALGLTHFQIQKYIVFPEVLRAVLPTISLLYISMFKLTSLASILSVGELTHTAGLVTSMSMRSLEMYVVIAIAYLSLTLPFSYLCRQLGNRETGNYDSER